MSILKLIANDSFITVNKTLIKAVGLDAAVLIGELASEFSYWCVNNGLDAEGYFFSTIENIEEKTSLSEHKQRQAIKKFEELGIIEVKVKGIPAKRYIRINEEKLTELFQNKQQSNSETSSGKIQKLDTENFKGNNNIYNNNINNNILLSETSSPKELDTSSDKEFLSKKETITNGAHPPQTQPVKRTSLKDQLVNYVNELDYSAETKQALFDWIFQIGLNGKVSLKQLQDKLAYIWSIYDDESAVRQSIQEAYRNNWFGFFPLKNRPQKYPLNQAKKGSDLFVNNSQDKIYTETQKPVQTKKSGCLSTMVW